ncbi:MAG: phosphoribosylglycinamide formyltransferase [Thermoguttaceae bacterium]|jgi:phosphoribosylglycinamide formyltransferase-1|nr:phosphoribosylglycinamide formyltransferase [Thermoguttaceae bacterium]
MARKMPIAVLISGGGRTLKNILDHIDAGKLDVVVKLVIASSPKATGIKFAEEAGIPVKVFDRSEFMEPRVKGNKGMYEELCVEYSNKIFDECAKCHVRYVVLAGYMTILTIPEAFDQKVLNIHPSLLPAFGGRGFYGRFVHEAALKRGVKITGCTVHFVNNDCDGGPIILQKEVEVLEDDTVETLSDRVLYEAEFVAYPEALQLLAENRIKVERVHDATKERKVVRILPGKK